MKINIRIMENEPVKKGHALSLSILFSTILLTGAWVYTTGLKAADQRNPDSITAADEGIALPVAWGDLGAKIVNSGAIDAVKFTSFYRQRGLFTEEYEQLLTGQNNGKIKMTNDNAGYLLNLFWALGLSSKNPILESGEINNRGYGGAQRFASTAGWTMARGDPMDHYSQHSFFMLTSGQQALVDKVSDGIYRPCCDNPAHFPDCNHGMAMLGLLELLASQDASEQEMWAAALTVNSYWFPENYLTIAAYMRTRGVDWRDVSPREILGKNYSSLSGYANVAARVVIPRSPRVGGCGVDTGEAPSPKNQPGGCSI